MMTTTFSVTRDQCIVDALQINGAYDPTNPPVTADYTTMAFTFNMMIKAWIRTMPMWKIEFVTVPLVSGTTTYQVGPYASGTGAVVTDKILKVMGALVRDNTIPATPYDIPIEVISIQEYQQFGSKTSQGVVNSMVYFPLDDSLSPVVNSYLNVYPTPGDNNHSLILTVMSQLNDVNVGTDPLDFPQECYLALVWGLADLTSFKYNVPLDKADRIERKAKMFFDQMADWSQENAESIRMMYDRRNG